MSLAVTLYTQCYLPPDTSEHTPPYPQPVRSVLDLRTPDGWMAELTKVTGYIPRWFTRLQTVTHPSTNPVAHGRDLNSHPVDHKSDALTTTPPSHLTTLLRQLHRLHLKLS